MIHYSVLIPQRDSSNAVRRLLPELGLIFDKLILPYELICIDDASTGHEVGALEELLYEYSHLRVLRFDEPRGTSAALCAGLFAARGDLILTIDPRAAADARYIPHLIARLSRHDFVYAEREQSLRGEIRQRLQKLPRLLRAAPQVDATESLFWAARREAVVGLALARGSFRVLPGLVAQRGFHVGRLTLSDTWPVRGTNFRLNWFERQALRWLDRRFEPHLALELVRNDFAVPRSPRAELPRFRVVPHAALIQAKPPLGGST